MTRLQHVALQLRPRLPHKRTPVLLTRPSLYLEMHGSDVTLEVVEVVRGVVAAGDTLVLADLEVDLLDVADEAASGCGGVVTVFDDARPDLGPEVDGLGMLASGTVGGEGCVTVGEETCEGPDLVVDELHMGDEVPVDLEPHATSVDGTGEGALRGVLVRVVLLEVRDQLPGLAALGTHVGGFRVHGSLVGCESLLVREASSTALLLALPRLLRVVYPKHMDLQRTASDGRVVTSRVRAFPLPILVMLPRQVVVEGRLSSAGGGAARSGTDERAGPGVYTGVLQGVAG